MLGHRVMAPSTLGTLLLAFSFGHVRRLDAVISESLRRAWALGLGPGAARLVVDVDSTICVRHEVALLRVGSQEGGPAHVMMSAA